MSEHDQFDDLMPAHHGGSSVTYEHATDGPSEYSYNPHASSAAAPSSSSSSSSRGASSSVSSDSRGRASSAAPAAGGRLAFHAPEALSIELLTATARHGESYVVYVFRVKTEQDREYLIERRYKDIEWLYEELCLRFGEDKLKPFPPRKVFQLHSTSGEVVNERRQMFTTFFRDLSSRPELLTSIPCHAWASQVWRSPFDAPDSPSLIDRLKSKFSSKKKDGE